MKNFLLVLFAFIMILISCEKEAANDFQATGTITGFDLALCACCGGWMIDIDGEEERKRFTDLPEDANIDLSNTDFPITVQLNWIATEEYCGKGITIQEIASLL